MSLAFSIYLDILRLGAALTVVAVHMKSADITGPLLWRVGFYATDSVIVFFVLSGFVISYVAATQARSVRTYAISRAARLYSVAVPALFVTLIADMIGLYFRPDLYIGRGFFNADIGMADIASWLTFTNEIWFRHVIIGSNEPYWSLGFETVYYVIFAVLFFFRHNVRIIGTALLIALAGPKIMAYMLIWLLGWIAFSIVNRQQQPGHTPLHPALGALLIAASAYAYLAIHAQSPAFNGFIGRFFDYDAPTLMTWCYNLAIALLFVVHLVGFAAIAPVVSPLLATLATPIRWLAGASFTLYLVHQPIMLCITAVSPWPAGTIAGLLFVALGTLSAVLVVAELGERRKRWWHQTFTTFANRAFGHGREQDVDRAAPG